MSWLMFFTLAKPPEVQPPDFSPPALHRQDSIHFAWQVDYYMRIIPWYRPNPFLHHPQIQQCLKFTVQNGQVVFLDRPMYAEQARRLEILYTTFFDLPRALKRCGFLPEWLGPYLKYGHEFIPRSLLSRLYRRSWILSTLWSNLTGGAGLVILKNVKRRWVMPWEKAWKAGYRSVFVGDLVETILPSDTFLGRLDRDGKVRLWSVLGPFEGGTFTGSGDDVACKVPPGAPLMLMAYIPFASYPHIDTLGLPGAIFTMATFRLEIEEGDTLVIDRCDYLRPWEIETDVGKRVIRFESDTTRMIYVRKMVKEIRRWVEKVHRGEKLEPVRIPLSEFRID